MKMKCNCWMFIPIIVSVFTIVGFFATYAIALQNKKICRLNLLEWKQKCYLRPPLLSIAGDTPPESSIFSQVLNMTAFLVITIGVLRYAQLKAKVKKPWLNIFGLITSSLTSFGMTIVANFQLSNYGKVHNVGSVITIAFGGFACWIHAVLTFQANINNKGLKLGIFRVFLSAIFTLSFIIYFLLMAQRSYLPSARVQWVSITSLLLYVGSFAIDFQNYDFEVHSKEKQENPSGNVSSVIAEYHSEHL
ncbi:transmembrane protein 150C isoform X2 [Narcine bancroftii]|uniref:transmembrane protein 150C isoform X2 n=1 Tax=Narcine bancroftii TaxID=1343680 RepID=UPI003831DD45